MLPSVLWIPTLTLLGEKDPSPDLIDALKKEGLYEKEVYHPIEIAIQSSLREQTFALPVARTLGFSFAKLWFKENQGSPDNPIIHEEKPWYRVHLQNAEGYAPQELARYFKTCWQILRP